MKNQYHKTIYACFLGYIVQAIVNKKVIGTRRMKRKLIKVDCM